MIGEDNRERGCWEIFGDDVGLLRIEAAVAGEEEVDLAGDGVGHGWEALLVAVVVPAPRRREMRRKCCLIVT